MGNKVPSEKFTLHGSFDDHAVAIAKRQYFQPGDNDLAGMLERVATWVAQPESEKDRESYRRAFFDLMASKRFCPGGRVLAGAATSHGNVLNCFVQDGRPEEEGTTPWVLRLASKLALVTKVGGGNGLCLDPLAPKRPYRHPVGKLFLTINPGHADYAKVRDGTFMDLVHGKYVTRGYRYLEFVEYDAVPAGAQVIQVGDSVEGIWGQAGEMVQKLLEGEDVLVDLSGLRAEGTPVKGSGGTSSGPSSFAVEIFDNFGFWASLGGADYAGPVATLRYLFASSLRAIRQGGTRRGAGMATMSITHPDIHDFITAKDIDRERTEGDISTFNISVLVSDDFMAAARKEGKASLLYDIADHAWQTGEPGIIFVDRINQYNPMRNALGDIKATNPCGEIPLFPGEPCDLGAINLAAYVTEGNKGLAGFDRESFRADVRTCIRFLDNVLEVNNFALEDNRRMSHYLRRLGLGIMGLADALILMGYRYDSEDGRAAVENMIAELREASTAASEELALERGVFPGFPESDLAKARRNIALLTVAPTGTTSMLMGVSSGVEPIFAPFIYRKIGDSYAALIAPLFKELLERHAPHPDFQKGNRWDWDKVVEAVQANHGSVQGLEFIPDAVKTVLLCAHDVAPEDHVRMQAVVQRSFDGGDRRVANSISKCIAVGTLIPTSSGLVPIEDFSANERDDSFSEVTEELYADGHRITAHYRAGSKPATRITLDSGATLTGARDSHRVLTPEGWTLMSQLKPGDWVLGKLLESHGPGGMLLEWDSVYRANANRVPVPERMSPELAEWLGMLAADGHTTESTGNVGLTCKDEVVEQHFAKLCSHIFGLEPRVTVDKRNGVHVLSLTSRNLARFVASLIGKGARNKRAPKQVLRGSRDEKLAFLRGVTLDGYSTPQGLVVYGGTSKTLAYHVSEMLRSFGKPKTYTAVKAITGSDAKAYCVYASNELQELIAPIEAHKNGAARFQTYNVYIGGDVVENTHLTTKEVGYGNLNSMRTRGVAYGEVATAERIGWNSDQLIYRVKKVEDAGNVEMFDIEVDEVHSYVVNGIISHNTINLPNRTTTDDVYDAYALAFDTGCKGITVYRDGSREFQVLSTSSKKESQEEKAVTDASTKDAPVKDPAPKAPTAEERPVAAVAEKVEPGDAPQAAPADPATAPSAPPASPPARTPAVPPAAPAVSASAQREGADAREQAPRLPGEPLFDRAGRVSGFTDKVKLTLSNGDKRGFYVTVNKQDSLPAEVFITSGKAGDEANADSEALGRVVSIALQYGVPAEAIVHTLRGINGGMYGSYQGRMVASKADLIAVALETSGVENTLNRGVGCPDCGAPMRFEEGCMKCESCGFSKCG